MANTLTICRIIFSFALLTLPALSPAFLTLYALAGATDMLDGYVARKTGTQSDFGSKLDSVADLILVIVSLVKILPAVSVPIWLWVWIAMLFIVKAANAIIGYAMRKRTVLPHTTANKVAGLMVFFVPFALPFVDIAILAIPACIVATFAAVQECYACWSMRF